MRYTLTIRQTFSVEFEGLYGSSWMGAKDTLDTIREHGKEAELLELIINDLATPETEEYGVDAVALNDYLWFDADYIFEVLGIDEDEE